MKKNFVVDPAFNPQNDRWIRCTEDEENDLGGSGDPGGKFFARSKHPAEVMFLGVVASTEETSPPV